MVAFMHITVHANTSKRTMSIKVAFIVYGLFNGPVGRLEGIEALCCTRIHISLLNWNWQTKDYFFHSFYTVFSSPRVLLLDRKLTMKRRLHSNTSRLSSLCDDLAILFPLKFELRLYLVIMLINKGDVLSLEEPQNNQMALLKRL